MCLLVYAFYSQKKKKKRRKKIKGSVSQNPRISLIYFPFAAAAAFAAFWQPHVP